jgi:hypothetical protein
MNREGTTTSFSPERQGPAVTSSLAEEALVSDARAGLTPAQMVERKLVALLRSTPLPVSRLQDTGRRRMLS